MVPVEKTNRTIKAILERSVGEGWRGREVFVEEVDPSWSYLQGAFFLVTPDGRYRATVKETEQWQEQFVHPTERLVLVTTGDPRKPSNRASATIYIPQLDHVQLDVARDALLAGDKPLLDTLLKPFDAYAGIARAILERQVRSFAKAMHPKKSTKQIRREVDDFLRSQGRL